MNGPVRKPYKKRYEPSPLEHALASTSPHTRGVIKPGAVVTVVAHYGPFRRIRDGAGNEMSVGQYALVPVEKTR